MQTTDTTPKTDDLFEKPEPLNGLLALSMAQDAVSRVPESDPFYLVAQAVDAIIAGLAPGHLTMLNSNIFSNVKGGREQQTAS